MESRVLFPGTGDTGALPPPCYQSAVGSDDNGVGGGLSSSNLTSSSDEDNFDTESIGTDSNCEAAGSNTAGRVVTGQKTSAHNPITNAHQKMVSCRLCLKHFNH